MRQAEIYRKGILAGILTEDGGEYRFCYDELYLSREETTKVSGYQQNYSTSSAPSPSCQSLRLCWRLPSMCIFIGFNKTCRDRANGKDTS